MAKLLKGNLENVDLNSPLFRYLCNQSQCQSPMDALKQRRGHLSPLSPLENLIERSPPWTVYRTPVRGVQREEVLVMDGVLVTRGGRSSRSASDLLSSSSSSDSSGKILYKTDLCRSWEDSGSCRYTSKGQADALDEFTGGVILVSHDSRLIPRLCEDEGKSEIWGVEDGTVRAFPGTFEEYKEELQRLQFFRK